jgi:hypothetical protein
MKHCPGVPILMVATDHIIAERHSEKRGIKSKVKPQHTELLLQELKPVKLVQVSMQGSYDAVFAEAVRAALSRFSPTEIGAQDEKCIIS